MDVKVEVAVTTVSMDPEATATAANTEQEDVAATNVKIESATDAAKIKM